MFATITAGRYAGRGGNIVSIKPGRTVIHLVGVGNVSVPSTWVVR